MNNTRRIGLLPLLAGIALAASMALPASAGAKITWQARIYYTTGPGQPLSVLHIGHWTQSGCQQALSDNVNVYLPIQGNTVVTHTACTQIGIGTPLPNVDRTD